MYAAHMVVLLLLLYLLGSIGSGGASRLLRCSVRLGLFLRRSLSRSIGGGAASRLLRCGIRFGSFLRWFRFRCRRIRIMFSGMPFQFSCCAHFKVAFGTTVRFFVDLSFMIGASFSGEEFPVANVARFGRLFAVSPAYNSPVS